MAAKFAVVLALCFVAAVSAGNSWDDWEPPAQDGLYSDGQYVEIDGRVSKCVRTIGSINGQSFDRPGDECKTHALWKLLEQPITKEDVSDLISACLADRKEDIGEAKYNQVTKCLKDELAKPLVASDDDNWE